MQHRDLAEGRWRQLSLAEQLGHVDGSTGPSLQKYFDAFAVAAKRVG